MKTFKLFILTAFAVTSAGSATGAEPSGYYDSCKGKSGAALLSALCNKISSHTTVSYSGLWDLYRSSDVDDNGKIWDMYSTKRWNAGEKCGNVSKLGGCYNREHSLPKSWFDAASPMYSEAYHIYPTDGKVNGQRGNYPFGECENGTTLAPVDGIKALGRLGKSTFPGYSGTVFEPDDQYKGDFARSYFYMAACYNDRISSWHSDAMAGNKYPAFKEWTVNLLLKWHREDPVSKKELDRNEAVAKRQKNRNPFIDHPELAEHIWGNKKTTPWNGDSSAPETASFVRPSNGQTVDLGRTTLNNAVTATISVSGKGFTSNVSATVSGAGFSVSPASLSASAVNAGTSVTVTYRPTAASQTSATLTFSGDGATATVKLTGDVVSGIPANQPTNIDRDAFTANWVNVGSASTVYTLYVTQNGSNLAGYPRQMAAGATSYRVTGLEEGSTYVYWVTGLGLESNHVTVTTHSDLPEINALPDEDLVFTARPGEPSRDISVTVDAYMIDHEIEVSVDAPFEVSTDRSRWFRAVTLDPDDDHFFIRVNSADKGVFYSAVTMSADGYVFDDLRAMATISDGTPAGEFFESFEAMQSAGYSEQTLELDAASWRFDGAGAFADDRVAHTGSQGVRFNRDAGSYAEMTTGPRGSFSKLTFMTRLFDAEAAEIAVEISTDGGKNWKRVATVTPTSDWRETAVDLDGDEADLRVRFVKTSGARVALDDVSLTGSFGALGDVTSERRAWDAYNLDGDLAVDVAAAEAIDVNVYSLDGIRRASLTAAPGITRIVLPAGLYIVVVGDDSRRVIIR